MRLDTLPQPWVRGTKLAGDASTRQYARVWDAAERTAILVQYPEAVRRQLRRDLQVRTWFAGHGLRVPAVIDHDLDRGWAIVEDLGEADAEALLQLAKPGARAELASCSLEPLVTLARIAPERLPRFNPPLDAERLRWELAGFELWFVRHRCRQAPGRALGRWLDELAQEVGRHPRRICHRDYHLNNLFLLADGAVGLIDTQDVLLGPDTYDLASLLNERAMPALLDRQTLRDLEDRWAARTGADWGWQLRLHQVRIQRALKVLGTFARLEAGGRSGYGCWLEELARRLSGELENVAAPPGLSHLLLDL